MTRFNPFARVSCRYGAPMGRAGDDPETCPLGKKLYVMHCGGDGSYDKGGAYWGHGNVYAVYTRGGAWCAYVEAVNEAHAMFKVLRTHDAPRSGRCRLDATGKPLCDSTFRVKGKAL